jgi:hypothetical protein
MGKVRMTEPGDRIPGVYAVENVLDYTYCDKCGSFDIGIEHHEIRPATRILTVAIGLFAVAGVFSVAVVFAFYWSSICLLGMIGLIALLILKPRKFLKCRKCGNEHITNSNVLRLQADDRSKLDVPEPVILKHPVETRIY